MSDLLLYDFETVPGETYTIDFDLSGSMQQSNGSFVVINTNLRTSPLTDANVMQEINIATLGHKQLSFTANSSHATFGLVFNFVDTVDAVWMDSLLIRQIQTNSYTTVYSNNFAANTNYWRNILVPPVADSLSFGYNQVGALVWQDSTQDLKAYTRHTTNLGNPALPPNAVYAQKDLYVQGGKPYTLNLHIKEMGPDALYGIVFVVRKQEIQQNGFGALGSQYALLAQQTFTDTGQLAITVFDNQSEELIVITGYASNAPSYMVLDDVSLSTYAEQTYLTQTFDEDITPWRNYVLAPDTTMLQPGEMAYDGTGQRLHITQGDFSIPGNDGSWVQAWAGAAAFSFAVEPGKHYRLKYDYQPGTVDTLTSMGGVNILSTTELQMGGLFGARRLYEQPSQNTGTTTTGILTVNDTSMTILFYALSPQNLNATAGDFYIDNIVIEEVTEVQCSDAEILAFNMQNGKYRYGFNGMEKDDEVNGNDNWYTFGDYGYDPRIVQRPSPDPILTAFQSSYSTFNGNPIIFADPSGESGELRVDNKSKTMTVNTNVYIYGGKASKKLAAQLEKNANKLYNESGQKVSLIVNGKEVTQYNLKFKIKVIYKADVTDDEIKNNTDVKNNYYRVEDDVSAYNGGKNTSFSDALSGGSNTGAFRYDQISNPNSTTFAHEIGHGFGMWNGELNKDRDKDGHPFNMNLQGKQPGIMSVPSDGRLIETKTKVDKQYQDKNGYLDINKRKVTSDDIKNMFLRPIQIQNGKGRVGNTTNYSHFPKR